MNPLPSSVLKACQESGVHAIVEVSAIAREYYKGGNGNHDKLIRNSLLKRVVHEIVQHPKFFRITQEPGSHCTGIDYTLKATTHVFSPDQLDALLKAAHTAGYESAPERDTGHLYARIEELEAALSTIRRTVARTK
jgi:hypothetical protein